MDGQKDYGSMSKGKRGDASRGEKNKHVCQTVSRDVEETLAGGEVSGKFMVDTHINLSEKNLRRTSSEWGEWGRAEERR